MIDLSLPALDIAPLLLGAVITHTVVLDDGSRAEVGIRLTEVEAYMGPDDPASHAFRGPTPRTTVMFGPPSHLYVYLSYGIHRCVNVVCSPDGRASAVLLRAGEVVRGREIARRLRSGTARQVPDRRLACGPGNLGQALGAGLPDSGAVLWQDDGLSPAPEEATWRLQAATSLSPCERSRRVGISHNAEKLWRFTIPGDPTVSRPR